MIRVIEEMGPLPVSHGAIRVRFAPSPTGYLHIGGLRGAFFNWLFARHYGGKYLLRIEDTDLERSKDEYTKDILDSFKWARIESDEPVVIQSEFFELHKQVAFELLEQNKAYKCFCTPEELAQRLQAAQIDGQAETHFKYDEKCRREQPTDSAGKSFAIRFKVPHDLDYITFDDLIRGEVTVERDQLDDFILLRSDGTPTYNFVVVIDDARMNISHVLRGEEHISNTPKQILIYEACGYKLPKFGHLPLILNPDGSKLSKRSSSAYTTVKEYRQNGFLSDALCNYLVRLGWSHGNQEIFTRDELIKYFSIEHVGKKGAIFDIKKLEWINGVYIRNTSSQDLLKFIICDVMPDFKNKVKDWPEEKLLAFIDLYKERVKTLKELAQEIISLYLAPAERAPEEFNAEEIREYLNQDTIKNIEQVISLIKEHEKLQGQALDHESLSIAIKELCKKLGIKLPDIAKPLRLAITGKTSSPGIFELISLLSPDDRLKRLLYFIKYIESRK